MKQKSVKITHNGRRENKIKTVDKRRGFKRAIYTWNKTEDATSFCRDFPVQHITTEEAPRFLWLYLHSTVIERVWGRALGSRRGFTHSTRFSCCCCATDTGRPWMRGIPPDP